MLSLLHPLQGFRLFQWFTRYYPSTPQSGSIYDLTVNSIDGEAYALSQLKGKVTLIVNVASRCGFTPQYDGLQKLQAKYAEQGFTIIAFPCNQFGGQEPEVCPVIKKFAQDKFKAEFPMMDKIDVNGDNQSAVYTTIKSAIPGNIRWNFEKVLVDKDGNVKLRYGSLVEPEALESDIENLIATPATPVVPPQAAL